MSKIALGTAQFGMSYGIANKYGKLKLQDIKKIIEFAKKKKIDLIDTAISYKNSEKTIGKIGILDFKIVSKLPYLPKKEILDINSWVREQIKLSLIRLRVKSLCGILIHNSQDLNGEIGKRIIDTLHNLKSKGIVEKIGISIYDPNEFEKFKKLINFDIIQAPLNILDRRILDSGLLSKFYKTNVEFHARSVFLQGLLLMSKQDRPSKFNKWSNLWKLWHEWLNDNKIKPLEAAIRYVLSIKEVSKVIVGVESKDQLKQILEASNGKLPNIPNELAMNDINLLNPSNWSKI